VDRASLVIAISFVGGAALLVVLLWLLVRLDRSAARATGAAGAVAAPAPTPASTPVRVSPTPVPAPPVLVLVADAAEPEPEPEPEREPEPEPELPRVNTVVPVAAPPRGTGSRGRIGATVGVAAVVAVVAILLLVIGARHRRSEVTSVRP